MGQADMPNRTCSLCPAPEVARGWCRRHYTRWRRWGDPLKGEHQIPAGTSGVYSITCLANGWVYIGSTMSVRQRWTTHRSWLRCGTHNVPQLQADYDEYGPEAFSYDLVSEVVDAGERYDREQAHITTALATGKCYNLSPSARDNTGHRYTPEQSRKLSDALKGKPKSAEHRANLWRDREVTPEHRENMRLVGSAGAGVPKSAEHRERIGAAQQGSGNHRAKLTEDQVREVKRRLAAGEKGRALAVALKVSESVISNIKHGHVWQHVTLDDPAVPETLF